MDSKQIFETWENTKNYVSKMTFPKIIPNECRMIDGNSHIHNGERHDLHTYRKVMKDTKDFMIEAEYTYCPDCKQNRTQKVTAFNNHDGVAFVRFFLRCGENVNSSEYTPQVYKEKNQVGIVEEVKRLNNLERLKQIKEKFLAKISI